MAVAFSVCALAVMSPTQVQVVSAFQPQKPVNFVIVAGQGGGADKMAQLMHAIIEKYNSICFVLQCLFTRGAWYATC